MRYFNQFIKLVVLCLSISMFVSCKSTLKPTSNSLDMASISLETPCPENMDCSVDVKQNTRIVYQQTDGDNFKLQFVNDEKYNVIVIITNRIIPEQIADAQYREELYFEIPKQRSELHLSDESLQKINAVFGRFCYCPRPAVGYFKITQGKLDIANGLLHFEFDNASSQDFNRVLTEIKASYKLN